MIKGKELLGRHVVDLSTGERVDSVRDIVFDHGANLVLGLVVDGGGSWLRRRDRVIPFSVVYSVGEDAVMITSAQDTASDEEQARMKEIMDSKVNLIGMTLLTAQGEDLGRIGDVVFDEYSGRVEGYEVTGGLFGDVAGGHAFVPAPESVQIGKDVAIVPASVAEEMRRSGGAWPSGAPQEPEHTDYSREEVAEQAAQRQRDYLIGRIAGTTITLPDGTVVAEKGEPITEEQVTRAERSGRLMILTSTSLSPEEVAEVSSAEESSTPQPAAPDPALTAPERSSSPLETTTPEPEPLSFSEMVGRRVREDVTDSQGQLIAAQGQIITPAILTRAEEQGLLEQIQHHLKEGTESAAEPLDLGEYERRSSSAPELREALAPAPLHVAPAVHLNAAPEEGQSLPQSVEPEPEAAPLSQAMPAVMPPVPVQESRPVLSHSGILEAPETPEIAQTLDIPERPERVMRARTEQVVHLSEPTPEPEVGLLEKARRWLDDRREDLLHDPSERELVQVHEQWGEPVTQPEAQFPPASHVSEPPAVMAPVTAPQQVHAPTQPEDTETSKETLVLRGPAPQLTDDLAVPAPQAVPEPVELDLDLSTAVAEPLVPVAAAATPSADKPNQDESRANEPRADEVSAETGARRTELTHPASAPQPAPQPVLPRSELTARPEPSNPLSPGPLSSGPVSSEAELAAPEPTVVAPPASLHGTEQGAAPGSEAFNQAIENIVQQAYGWPVVRTVKTEDGQVILTEGGRVTPAVVAEAKRLGVLRELLSAVQRGE
ncbi:hypothetical protein GCM10017783_09710 [Deinococcus piscis]|uniref:PRC-barrel domain-containing protein n=1 Tax=Deinococcus piscis TaxID=394230 RepID=A0ABQ3K217_9DEIO|nr:PRC-barrel domain-containing protein [Deinococcus piscis]GHF99672.1 hypothetical protein GCM10017783_09710 [Deinococcus piscis]